MSSVNLLDRFCRTKLAEGSYLTATEFAEIWGHFDKNGNGFIDGTELDQFLDEFCRSICMTELQMKGVSEEEIGILKKELRDNLESSRKENKVDISELAQLLPVDEEFLLLFHHHNPLPSSVEFMKIWRTFDMDKSGYIEANELKDFLRVLLKEAMPGAVILDDALLEYSSTILELFDLNRDGKLQLSEMARLLPTKENYLCRPIFRNTNQISEADIDRVFSLYDQDHDGCIHDLELEGFVKDLLELVQDEYDRDDIEQFIRAVLDQWDVNRDGRLDLDEMRMMLRQQRSMAKAQKQRKHSFQVPKFLRKRH